MVLDLGQMLGRTLGEHVDLDVRADRPVSVFADLRQIEHVVLNLCLNARDAMPDGGRICIEVAPVELDAATAERIGMEAGEVARLRVRDDGTGMAPEVLDRAFEPFFTTKGPGEGTGLGLATVYGSVGQNGGSIDLTSTVGRGTTVDVYLPAVEPAPSAPPGLDARPLGGSERILVVEDELRLREVTARMLAERGYDVVVADSPAHALDLLTAPEADVALVLTDVVMPDLSGPAMVAEVRRRLADRAPGVVFMSGYAASDSGIGSEPVLAKPFSEADLLAAIREELDG